MPEYALDCIVCDKQLKNVFPDVVNQPSCGTAFTTVGHYGSTVFDSMGDRTFLELNVCDECLKRLASNSKVLMGERQYAKPSYSRWDGKQSGD